MLVQPVHAQPVGHVVDVATVDEVGCKTGLRERRDVRRASAFGANGNQGLEVTAAFVHHINTGGLFKGNHRRVEPARILIDKRTKNVDGRSGEVLTVGPRVVRVVDVGRHAASGLSAFLLSTGEDRQRGEDKQCHQEHRQCSFEHSTSYWFFLLVA